MLSPSQQAMHEALDAFSRGDIEQADQILERATHEGRARAEVDEALSLCCMRASLAAMEGAANVAQLMASVMKTPQGAAATSYLEGLAALAKNSLQSARVKFEEAQRRDPSFKLASLGMAVVHFQMKEYKKSFSHYREALCVFGSEVCPPIVRVGMGLCAYHLGNLEEARRFLERALEVNPDDELALFGLLVVYLDRRVMAKVTEVVGRLRERLPHNTMVLLKVGELMYFKALGSGRVKASLRQTQQLLAEVRRTGTAEECAMADCQEGRLLLASGNLTGARPLLESALCAFPTLLAARIHYARLLHYSGKENEALQLLRTINADHPNQREVLQLLAVYASRRGWNEAALKYCRLLTETVAQGDLRSWSLAAWCSRLNPTENAPLFAQVVHIHRELKRTPPWQLLANVAVVNQDAEALQAILDRELGGDFTKKPTLSIDYIPLVFNCAHLLERTDAPRARQLYLFLVKRHSRFVLAYLRLHEMARREGLWTQAVAWLALLSEVVPNEPNAQARIAQMFFAGKHYSAAMTVLKRTQSKAVPVALAQGAMFLWACQHAGSSRNGAVLLKRAKDRFVYVLDIDKDNILAAHGLACCLGLERRGDQCQAMLNGVNEVTPNSAYVRENLNVHMANVKALSERYKQAVDYYLKVPQRTPQQNSLLAFCYACDGHYEEAIATLSAALEQDALQPEAQEDKEGGHSRSRTHLLKYNLAVVCCSSFLSSVATHRSLTVAEGRELNELLKRGLSTAFEVIRHHASSRLPQGSRLYLKSLCNYTLNVHDTIFKQLLIAGVESSQEHEREAERWRETFAAFRAEMDRDEEQRGLQEARRKAEREEKGRKVLSRFLGRRQADPIEFPDPEIHAARVAEVLANGDGDLMNEGMDGVTEMHADAALTGMDIGDAGGDAFLDPGDFAG